MRLFLLMLHHIQTLIDIFKLYEIVYVNVYSFKRYEIVYVNVTYDKNLTTLI
jgi:hypothetical protein